MTGRNKGSSRGGHSTEGHRRYGSQSKAMALRKQEEKQRLASTASSTGQESECNNCNRIIKDDETEIRCDGMCEGIFHVGCVALSTEEHSVIHAKGNNISWFCDPCGEAVSELIADDI